MNERMDRSRLNVGCYYLQPYARTERHVKELSEAGIDFVVGMNDDRPTLDLLQHYGIGVVLSGAVPGWYGCDGSHAGEMESIRPLTSYERGNFTDHPAIWGIDVGDEPSMRDFPHLGRVISRVQECFPDQLPYLNLFPAYGWLATCTAAEAEAQLGTASYEEYIAQYCRHVPTDYLCYDFYLYSASLARYYECLRITSDACARIGRSLWIVLQVNSHRPETSLSENQLRYQAFSAMAFGVETVIWACYTAGWWYHFPLDEAGNRTEQYDKLKTVNGEIHRIGETYRHYRRVATHLVEDGEGETLPCLDTDGFLNVRADGGQALLVGQMVSRDGSGGQALMICAADDPYDEGRQTFSVVFHPAAGKTVRAIGGSGELSITKAEEGTCAVTVSSNQGILLTATDID